ncbi:MAG TPA: acyl-CoA dehydrogenase family protein, partial [Aggregatilineales bacterium]|nr:acyl-CoA dehydrogenase family protein [Aggregatilineales bacterium]
MNNATRGRSALQEWESSKPDNFFSADRNLQRVLRHYLSDEAYSDFEKTLVDLGEKAATILDETAKLEDHIGNHPLLNRWTGIGERIEEIEFHPGHDLAGRIIWESGVMALQAEAGNSVKQAALIYLLTHNGEASHMCSLACTSGMIRALQQAGSDELKAKFLPPLLDRNYEKKHHAAQFLTEVQGGSDVGANAVIAHDTGDGSWRISGEKWFCSNINADQFLMTARPEGAADGTKGLGMFLVPRQLDDGSTNGFYIRRLKDKLGTRTLASAEVDFVDAVAYPIGALDRGFKNVVELVLNTSRLMNALSCAGFMRRAYLEAGSYACTREAFGAPIINYPLVQEALADMQSEAYAALASCFALAHLLDKIETGKASDDDEAAYRMFVNINKYITSIRATEMVHRAIEVLGGNGAIETFSILPRLYRDMVVLESWEGTHNVLCVQVWRDMLRYQLHEPFLRYIQSQLATVKTDELQAAANLIQEAIQRVVKMVEKLAASDEQ